MEVAEVDVEVDAEVVEEKEEEEEEEERTTLIKSNNPHLAGGEKAYFCSVLLCFLLALLMFQNLSPVQVR